MDPILDWLFQSDLDVPPRGDLKQQSSATLDAILQADEAIKEKLPQDHLALMTDYLERLWQYHSLEGQLQFERGFLLGFQLATEVLPKRCEVH